MAEVNKKSVRKLVTLSADTAERVDQFRLRSGATSESDALKVLIEGGLSRFDTSKDLFDRCRAASQRGQSIGEIINSVIADHPLVKRTSLDASSLRIYLRNDAENEPDERLLFYRSSKRWAHERRIGYGADENWAELVDPKTVRMPTKAELDDDIPF